MKKIGSAIALAALLVTSAVAGANNKYEFTPHVGYDFHQDDDKYFKDNTDLAYGLSFGKRVFDNTVFEFDYEKEYGVKYVNEAKTDIDRYAINALFEHPETTKIIPYVMAGVGYEDVHKDRMGIDDGKFLNVGLGLRYVLKENFHIKLLAKEILNEDGRGDFVTSLGITIALGEYGAKPAPVSAEKEKIAEKLPTPPMPPAPKVDGDSDGDGVPDSLDKCPNTPKKFKVDKDGCPEKYNLLVQFDFDKSKIKDEFKPEVEEFATFLKEYTIYDAVIEGHTDFTGSEAYNQKLSERRANAVKNYLIELGVDAARLDSKGYGESKPIADNETSEGRYQNRRVEAQISKK